MDTVTKKLLSIVMSTPAVMLLERMYTHKIDIENEHGWMDSVLSSGEFSKIEQFVLHRRQKQIMRQKTQEYILKNIIVGNAEKQVNTDPNTTEQHKTLAANMKQILKKGVYDDHMRQVSLHPKYYTKKYGKEYVNTSIIKK